MALKPPDSPVQTHRILFILPPPPLQAPPKRTCGVPAPTAPPPSATPKHSRQPLLCSCTLPKTPQGSAVWRNLASVQCRISSKDQIWTPSLPASIPSATSGLLVPGILPPASTCTIRVVLAATQLPSPAPGRLARQDNRRSNEQCLGINAAIPSHQ